MVQIFSTSKAARGVSANPTHGSGWIVQILSTWIWKRKCSRKEDNFVAPIRNDLNNPPTSVGGIHEVALSLVVDRI